MDNADVAAVFAEMADLLEIAGGDRYRARAFRRTADIIEGLRQPLARALYAGGIERIPGIGEGSVTRIKEILRTGTCAEHRRLLAKLPSSLRELLDVKGLGPRTVRVVYERLGITHIDQLEAAARAGALARLPGLNEKSQQEILVAIEQHRARAQRMLLPEALAVGSHVVSLLLEHPPVSAALQCGSARRLKPTVGDLDIVAGTDDPPSTVARFVTLPGVEGVWYRGAGRASVRVAGGHQMDLWTVAPSAFGAGIAAFTNGIRHNIALRLRATRLGFRLNEDGLFAEGTDRLLVACTTEEVLYRTLGLAFIPPELREDTGEIDAAEKGTLPHLVDDGALRGDLRVNLSSPRAADELGALLRAAKAARREYLVVTVPASTLEADGAAEAWVDLATDLGHQVGVKALAGARVPIGEGGTLEAPLHRLHGLDWVVGQIEEPPRPEVDVTDRLVRALEHGVLDAVATPTGRRLPAGEAFAVDIDRLAKATLRAGAALEVCGDPTRVDLDDRSARHCRDLGVPLALTSGATRPDELAHLHWAVCAARRGWCRPRDALNHLTAQDLLDRRRGSESTVPRARSLDPPERRTSPEAQALLAELAAPALPPEARARIEAFLRGTPDPVLEDALAALGDNPLQIAFNLLMKTAGPQILDP